MWQTKSPPRERWAGPKGEIVNTGTLPESDLAFNGGENKITSRDAAHGAVDLQALKRPIPDEQIAAIRLASPIEEVVAEHVQLRRTGRELSGICPFHSESTPSFYINTKKQVFLCRGCGAGGDVVTFIRNYLHVTFPEAVQQLAIRAGIKLNGFVPSEQLRAKVAAEQARRNEERAFSQFGDDRIRQINSTYRALAQAATRAEECLRAGILRPGIEQDLAWDALERYRSYELRVERDGLADPSAIRSEWETIRGNRDAA
jgi:hypothetical protein